MFTTAGYFRILQPYLECQDDSNTDSYRTEILCKVRQKHRQPVNIHRQTRDPQLTSSFALKICITNITIISVTVVLNIAILHIGVLTFASKSIPPLPAVAMNVEADFSKS